MSAENRDKNQFEILEAAAAAIARDGFHGMSMRALAKATGRGLASFYTYFDSKESVLFAIQSQAFEALVESSQGAIETVSEPSAKLYVFTLNHLRYFAEHPNVMRVLVQEAGALPKVQRAKIRALKDQYFGVGRDILRLVTETGCGSSLGKAKGKVDDKELERITYSYFGMLNWTYGWYEPKRHGSPEELARTVHQLMLCGMVAQCAFSKADKTQLEMGRALDGVHRQPLLRKRVAGGQS